MLNLEVLKIVFNSPSYEICSIVRDERVWDPISGYNVVSDEFLRSHSSDCLVGGCFHPLGEIVDRHEDKTLTIGGCRMDCSNNVYPPS